MLQAAPLAPISRIESADVWLDLIAQRPSATVTQGGRLVIDLGLSNAAKHQELAVKSPWRLGEEVDGARAGLLVGQGGSLEIPIDGDLAAIASAVAEPGEETPPLAMAITLRGLAPDQAVSVFWQEQVLANLTVGTGWERRTFSLPRRLVKAGDNRLRLHFRRKASRGGVDVSAAVRSVEVGAHAVIVGGAPIGGGAPYQADTRDLSATYLSLGPGSGLAFYVQPPRRARLRLDVRGRGSLEVVASTDEDHREGRPPTTLLEEPLRADGSQHEVDLSGYGGMPLRLEIRLRSRGEDASASFRALEIVHQRAIPVDRRERRPRDLYILAVEGARPDDLLTPAASGPSYPAIERFLGEAMVFERAYGAGPWAVPGHAALLSSIPPPAHRTLRGTFVAESHTLLTEVIDRAGFSTVAVTADLDVQGDRGLVQGFEEVIGMTHGISQRNDAVAVIEGLLRALDRRASPRFGYAVFSDPQAPYEPPREFQGDDVRPEDAPLPHLTLLWTGRVRSGKVTPTKAQLAYVRRLYRGELMVVDRALGDLLDALETAGSLDESIIVLVGLHGEEFFEHGGAGHGWTLYEESIRVPLAIRSPHLLAPGRVATPVDLLDLAPTLVDLEGLAFPPEWQGESLVPVIDDPQPPPRLVVVYLGDGSRAGIVGDAKVVMGYGRGLESQRFYDLGADPHEARDRLAEGGIALRIVRSALTWELADEGRWKRARWGTGADLRPAFALDRGM